MKYISLIICAIFLSICTVAQPPDNLPLKLRIGTYNVGHFNQGALGGFQGGGKHAVAEMLRWKE